MRIDMANRRFNLARNTAALLAILAGLHAAEAKSAQLTGATFSAICSVRVDIYQNLLPFSIFTEGASDGGVDLAESGGGISAWVLSPLTSKMPLPDDSSRFFGGTANAAFWGWGRTTGQIEAATAGATSIVNSNPNDFLVGMVASGLVRTSVVLRFDERVKFRMAYDGQLGSVLLQDGGAAVPLADFGFGAIEFETAGPVGITVTNGSSASAFSDGYSFTDLWPSLAVDSDPITTSAAFWTISPIDEEEPPVEPLVVTIPVTILDPIDPNGGFDPMPIGVRKVYVAGPSVGRTTLEVPTQIADGPFQGAVVEAYEFVSGNIPVTSLVLPQLPAGAALSITYGQQTRSVAAGELIDFGPAGVSAFVLSGFDPANASPAANAQSLDLQFAADGFTTLEVRATEYIDAADANADGVVDGADLAAWQANFGASATSTHAQGDFDVDQDVDGADFLLWQRRLGDGAPPVSPIPEPGGVLLGGFSVAGLTLIRRRRKAA